MSKETAFYPRLKAMTDEWMDLFGYWAPTVVTDTEEEYRAVRETAGLMDFTMLRKVDIEGEGAQDFVNSIVTRDVSKLTPGPHRLRRAHGRRREDDRRLHVDDALALEYPLLRRERPRLRDLQREGAGLDHRPRVHRRDAAPLPPGAQEPRDAPGDRQPGPLERGVPVLHVPRGRRDRRHPGLHDPARLHGRARLRALGRPGPGARALGRARSSTRSRRG